MSRHDDRVYLAHMRDHARIAIEISRCKTLAELASEPTLRYALLHLVCIIGEAASKVSKDARQHHSNIAWGAIVASRNRLIHGYDTVEVERLWDTVQQDLPGLLDALEKILEE